MKRTNFVGACAIACILVMCPLAWVSGVLSMIFFALAGILGTIWLVLQHFDYVDELKRKNDYYKRLKTK